MRTILIIIIGALIGFTVTQTIMMSIEVNEIWDILESMNEQIVYLEGR